MDDVDLLAAVGRTAIGVARIRAGESARPDPLFADPYAAAFVAAAGLRPESEARDETARRRGAAIAYQVLVRTRFFDDVLLDAAAAGCRQVVLLGAGLDARAFRLRWPAGVRLFELDQPDVLRLKAAVLTDAGAVPRSDRRAVAVDLRADWSARLVDAGFDREVPTAWLAEGLLVYLEPSDVEQLLTAMTELSAPGSRFAAERGDLARTMADAARAAATMSGTAAAAPDDVTRLWHDGPAAGLAGWLAAHGWQTTEHELGDLGTAYGRPPSAPTRSGFVTATR